MYLRIKNKKKNKNTVEKLKKFRFTKNLKRVHEKISTNNY